jgi:hypothetical protein
LKKYLVGVFFAVLAHTAANASNYQYYYGTVYGPVESTDDSACLDFPAENLIGKYASGVNIGLNLYSGPGTCTAYFYSDLPHSVCPPPPGGVVPNPPGYACGSIALLQNANASSSHNDPVATWTPTISFAGSSAGVTYAVQQGEYEVIGDAVFAQAYIQLSSKGTAHGAVSVIGLPIAPSGYFSYQCAGGGIVSGAAGMNGYTGQIAVNVCQNNAYLLADVSPGETYITDANLSNTSTLIMNFMYFKK